MSSGIWRQFCLGPYVLICMPNIKFQPLVLLNSFTHTLIIHSEPEPTFIFVSIPGSFD